MSSYKTKMELIFPAEVLSAGVLFLLSFMVSEKLLSGVLTNMANFTCSDQPASAGWSQQAQFAINSTSSSYCLWEWGDMMSLIRSARKITSFHKMIALDVDRVR